MLRMLPSLLNGKLTLNGRLTNTVFKVWSKGKVSVQWWWGGVRVEKGREGQGPVGKPLGERRLGILDLSQEGQMLSITANCYHIVTWTQSHWVVKFFLLR